MSDSNKKFILVEHQVNHTAFGKGIHTLFHPPFPSGKFYKRVHRAYLHNELAAVILRELIDVLGEFFGELLCKLTSIIILVAAYLIYYIVLSITVMPLGFVRSLLRFYWKCRGFSFEPPGEKS